LLTLIPVYLASLSYGVDRFFLSFWPT